MTLIWEWGDDVENWPSVDIRPAVVVGRYVARLRGRSQLTLASPTSLDPLALYVGKYHDRWA